MKTQNITLAISHDILRRIKLIAIEKETSVSGLLTQILTELVNQEEVYLHRQRRHLQQMQQGIDLGIGGKIATTREELHQQR